MGGHRPVVGAVRTVAQTAAQVLQERIGAHLRAHLHGKNTQAAVAAWLGVSQTQWSRYIRGQRSPTEATINVWLALCRTAGIDVPPSVTAGWVETVISVSD